MQIPVLRGPLDIPAEWEAQVALDNRDQSAHKVCLAQETAQLARQDRKGHPDRMDIKDYRARLAREEMQET
jgi:hypothetical protein